MPDQIVATPYDFSREPSFPASKSNFGDNQKAVNSKKTMFSSNGFRAPTQRYVPGASALCGVSEKWFVSDDYWTYAPRFLFTNWYLTGTGAGGQEAANGNAITIDSASIQVGLGGSPVQLLFGGEISKALADDTEAWNDANESIVLPPRTLFCVRTHRTLANSAHYLSAPAQGAHPMMGDKGEVSATSLVSKVMAGGVSSTLLSGSHTYVYAPVAMVAQGWDGRPVGLIVGTSIEQGVGQSRLHCNRYAEQGPAGLGMTSSYNGAQRYPAANWAVSGGLAAGIAGIGANQGLTRRMRAIAALPNVPFTFTLSGFGTNDQNATLSTWKTTMTTCWAALRAAWPTSKLIQMTLWSRISSTDAFTTVANQTLQTNWAYPAGSYWGLHAFIKENGGGLIDAHIDIMDEIDNIRGGGSRGKWRADVLDGWATTLSATVAGGVTAVTLAAQPRPGAIIAINDGTHEAAVVLTTVSTAAPFSIGLGAALAGAHTAAAVVKEALTVEGVHPGDLISNHVADRAIAAHKLAGTFG